MVCVVEVADWIREIEETSGFSGGVSELRSLEGALENAGNGVDVRGGGSGVFDSPFTLLFKGGSTI